MKRYTKWKKIEIICILLVAVVLGFMVKAFYQPQTYTTSDNYRSLSSGWYQLVNEKRIDIELPCAFKTDETGTLTLYNDSLTEADGGKVLSIDGMLNDLEVRLDDSLLYEYEESGFEKNAQMRGKLWADICLPVDTGEEPLCFIYSAEPGSRIEVQIPVVGSNCKIFEKHVHELLFSIVSVCGMIVLGIVALLIYGYTRYQQVTEKRFLNVAFFLLLCSLWCILDSGIYQVYAKQSAIGSVISFYAFMLMAIPMIHFVKNTIDDKSRWIPSIWIALFYGNALIQGIAYLIFRVPYIQMLPVTHILLLSGVVMMMILLWRECRRKRSMELKICLDAFGLLGLSGILALALYWIFSIYWYDAVFQFGILLYMVILVVGLARKIFGDMRFRMEQNIYESMSDEDRMTGLKNGHAFGECIENIQHELASIQDALLLFVDITNLKKINDTYGIKAGDAAVIRVAYGLQTVVASLEEEGAESFRVQGEEFAIIITNPQKTPQEWNRAIRTEVNRENSRYYIGLNIGYSYLKREDGTWYSVSDWKTRADSKLHQRGETEE